jgi:hypothetical protein
MSLVFQQKRGKRVPYLDRIGEDVAQRDPERH